MADYLAAVDGGGASLAILRRYDVTLVWQPRGAPLAALLQRTPTWSCVFATPENVLYAPRASAGSWHSSRASCPT